MHRKTFSRLLNAIFVLVIGVGHAGVALGLLGYLNPEKASLVTLVASAVACADVGVFFLLSYEGFARRSMD
jgi:hypothetical protein